MGTINFIMYKKLDIKHNLPKESGNDILFRFGIENENGFQGISYFKVSPIIENKIFDILPTLRKPGYYTSLMVINKSDIPAHNDDAILVSVNFYLNTANAITRFHSVKNCIEPIIKKLPMQTNGSLYQQDDLDIVGEFTADVGDVYLLDVTQLHSVKCHESNLRTAYVIQSTIFNFSQTLEFIEQGKK